jgi:hypothetical protein
MDTLSNETSLNGPVSGRQTGLFRLDVVLAGLLVVVMFSLLFPIPGHAIHCVGGIIMMAGCGIHLMMHTRWMKVAILETPQNVTSTLRRQRRMFWSMAVSGSFCGLSGLAALPFALGGHAFLPLHCLCMPVHFLSGLAFCGLTIYHLVLHRNWIRAQSSRLIV